MSDLQRVRPGGPRGGRGGGRSSVPNNFGPRVAKSAGGSSFKGEEQGAEGRHTSDMHVPVAQVVYPPAFSSPGRRIHVNFLQA